MTGRWVGAVLVSDDPTRPQTVVSSGGSGQGFRVVTPVGRLDEGQSPLAVAASQVATETGLDQLRYVGYLGEQRDGTSTSQTPVAWFLLAATCHGRLPVASGRAGGRRWAAWDDVADVGDHARHLRRASDLIAWRRAGGLPYSPRLGELVPRCSRATAEVLSGLADAGLGMCGSAARGDFVDGWSDVDLIGWGIPPSSPVAARLHDLAAELEQDYGVGVSVDLADLNGEDLVDGDPLYTAKLQGLFLRGATEIPVLAGRPPPVPSVLHLADGLDESVDRLRRFAVRHLASAAASARGRAERARRVLSVACHAARSVARVLDPQTPSDLGSVSSRLEERWPGNELGGLLEDYRRFRQVGAIDSPLADALADRVPEALLDLQRLIASAGMVGRPVE